MSNLLKELIETAAGGAVGAGAIATGGGHETVNNYKAKKANLTPGEKSMFGFAIKRKGWHYLDTKDITTRKVAESLVRKGLIEINDHGQFRLSEFATSQAQSTEDSSDFDTDDVISKLKHAEKANIRDDNTVGFALEDDQGNIVKVYVRKDQANEFEEALQAALANELEDDENKKERPSSKEISEVLYDLKDKFDIIDADFESIPEDEEEDQEAAGGEEGAPEVPGLEGGEEGGEGEGEGEGMEVPPEGELGGGEEQAASALDKVIDMMKAQAEADKEEANARKEQAKAEQAKYAAQAASAKVKQEEEVLDMESYYDAKNQEKGSQKTCSVSTMEARYV